MSFDALAPCYGSLEWIAFGEQLQRCRVACLDEIPSPCRALIVGEGNGRFLCELLQKNPTVEIDCVDSSARMLGLARARLEKELPERLERVRFLHEDIRSWKPPGQHYDLIITHFVLDCFPQAQLVEIIRKLSHAALDDAIWLLADFCVPAKGMARLRARGWLAAMYWFFRLTTRIEASELIDPTTFMRAEGFTLSRQRLFEGGMLRSEMWQKIRRRW